MEMEMAEVAKAAEAGAEAVSVAAAAATGRLLLSTTTTTSSTAGHVSRGSDKQSESLLTPSSFCSFTLSSCCCRSFWSATSSARQV